MRETIAGCLFGMALGDALGSETEFLSYDAVWQQYRHQPLELHGSPAQVTDDTQMAIAVAEALLATSPPYTADALTDDLQQHFIDWYHDPQNNRAPGVTCLTSVEKLIAGQHWQNATNISSKGCGANMRVQAVGLLPVDAVTRARIAQVQAALTHGHPTGLAASDLTAWFIAQLWHADDVRDLLAQTRAYATAQREVYHADWLGALYKRAMVFRTGEDFIAHGWDECLGVLEKVAAELATEDEGGDPCENIGQGWVAEEAFAVALYCFLRSPDDPVAAMRRAAISNGDSDSIACITGAFAGAYNGIDALPDDWVQRIEYHDTLLRLTDALTAMHTITHE